MLKNLNYVSSKEIVLCFAPNVLSDQNKKCSNICSGERKREKASLITWGYQQCYMNIHDSVIFS
jgi:hypothetical protein